MGIWAPLHCWVRAACRRGVELGWRGAVCCDGGSEGGLCPASFPRTAEVPCCILPGWLTLGPAGLSDWKSLSPTRPKTRSPQLCPATSQRGNEGPAARRGGVPGGLLAKAGGQRLLSPSHFRSPGIIPTTLGVRFGEGRNGYAHSAQRKQAQEEGPHSVSGRWSLSFLSRSCPASQRPCLPACPSSPHYLVQGRLRGQLQGHWLYGAARS